MEFFSTVDFYICLIVGAVAGLLAWQLMKDRGFGLLGDVVIGLVGGVVGGYLFDLLDFMDVGDVLDPIIAAVVGAVIFLGIASAFRRSPAY
jgi:uncharacterized membrane protein YeaQ/YmgE (transglycosylase-associated protein family)